MRISETTWDVALTPAGAKKDGYGLFKINLPSEISRSLEKRGFNRVVLELTTEGILLKPYEGTGEESTWQQAPVELPF